MMGSTDIIIEADAAQPNKEIDIKQQPSKEWEVDVRGLVSTRKWLQNYGLKKNRLSMYHLLPQIGFKHADSEYYLALIYDKWAVHNS